MRSEFSEFSFGFAFTHEYINRHPKLTAAPELPSLAKEGKPGGGWDLKLNYQGHAKFFQFKLSEYMLGNRAKHREQYGSPHYRFGVTPETRSDQHNMLRDLAKKYTDVHYVAPKFHTQQDFDDLFLGGVITDHSIWVPIKDLPSVVGNARHHLTFTHVESEATWQSDPVRLEGNFGSQTHYNRVNERSTINLQFFRELRQD